MQSPPTGYRGIKRAGATRHCSAPRGLIARSFEMRCTVPVPSPSDFATFKIPTPFASCFRTFRSVALSIFGRPSFTPWATARLRPAFIRSRIMLRSNSANHKAEDTHVKHEARGVVRDGKLGTASASPSITLAFAPSRWAISSFITSRDHSSCSSVIALTPPECSNFISRGTSKAQTFKYAAGDSRRTRLNTSRPCCCQSSARSSRKRLLNARRVASGEPPGFLARLALLILVLLGKLAGGGDDIVDQRL